MTVTIRRALVEDADAIAAVKKATWPSETASSYTVVQALYHEDHVAYVAVRDAQVVGFVDSFLTFSADSLRRWEIDLLAIHPEFQRQGIASQLVSASTQTGRDLDVKFARALVQVENVASQGTFSRCGFRADENCSGLYLAPEGYSRFVAPPANAHLIPVNTFNCRGLWLEGELTLDAFEAAQSRRSHNQWDVAGAVIPLNQKDAIRCAHDAGWQLMGHYQYWYRWLSTNGQPGID